MKKYLLAVLSLFVIFATGASYVSAQDSQRKNEGAKVEGRAGDTNFDVRIQGDKENRSRVHSLEKVKKEHRVRRALPAHPALKDPPDLLVHLAADSWEWTRPLRSSLAWACLRSWLLRL
jgi:hypothetical protein